MLLHSVTSVDSAASLMGLLARLDGAIRAASGDDDLKQQDCQYYLDGQCSHLATCHQHAHDACEAIESFRVSDTQHLVCWCVVHTRHTRVL